MGMPDTLDTQGEARMQNAIKRAIDLVDSQGMTPDDAVEKVAREEQFPPGKVDLICAAYNLGRQTSQRLSQSNILDKLASFPLASPEAVRARIYGKPVEKEAVDAEYSAPPTWMAKQAAQARTAEMTKVASAYPSEAPAPYVDGVRELQKALSRQQREKQSADELSRQASAAEDHLRGRVLRLTNYFRKAAHDRLSFGTVEKVALSYFEPVAVASLMNIVHKSAHSREKRAADAPEVLAASNLRAEPYSIIRECIDAAQDVLTKRAAAKTGHEKVASLKEETLRPFVKAGEPLVQDHSADPLYSEKAAGILGSPAVGTAVGTLLGRSLGDGMPKGKDDLVEDAWMDLEDPQHQNELRKIRAQAMLNSMMTDPEDPISGHDPDSVLKAYNELAQMAPRSSEQPAAIKPLLRRRLAGHVEPFEVKEVSDIERGLTGMKSPTPNSALLSDAPDKLLG